MSRKLPVNSFKWVIKLSKFDERFIKNCDGDSNKRYFLEVYVEYPKQLFNLHSDLPYLPERNKIKNVISWFVTYMTKKTMLFTSEL